MGIYKGREGGNGWIKKYLGFFDQFFLNIAVQRVAASSEYIDRRRRRERPENIEDRRARNPYLYSA